MQQVVTVIIVAGAVDHNATARLGCGSPTLLKHVTAVILEHLAVVQVLFFLSLERNVGRLVGDAK